PQPDRDGVRKAQGPSAKGRRAIDPRTLEQDRFYPRSLLSRPMHQLLQSRRLCVISIQNGSKWNPVRVKKTSARLPIRQNTSTSGNAAYVTPSCTPEFR